MWVSTNREMGQNKDLFRSDNPFFKTNIEEAETRR
jgi:hypothetical protein